MKEIIRSAIEWYDKRDYKEEIAWSDKLEGKCFSNIIYNQKFVDPYSCTGQASCWAISDITWLKQEVIDKAAANWTILPLSFRKRVWENQLKTWAVEWVGDTVLNWVKQAVKLFNEENPELSYKLAYYRISNIQDVNKLIEILEGWSSVITWYDGYLRGDAEDNWVIDNSSNKKGLWHCIRIVKAWKKDDIWNIKYCDNYSWVFRYNIITVNDFINNKNFFKGGYYLKKIKRT